MKTLQYTKKVHSYFFALLAHIQPSQKGPLLVGQIKVFNDKWWAHNKARGSLAPHVSTSKDVLTVAHLRIFTYTIKALGSKREIETISNPFLRKQMMILAVPF